MIAAGSLELQTAGLGERSSITIASFGAGDTGDIDIRGGRVLLDGGDQLNGASIQSLSEDEGSGGRIRLVVDSLDLLQGGIVFGELSGGSTDASSIEVTADTIRIDGSLDTVTGITLDVDGPGTAAAGAIIVSASDIDIRNGGKIESTTVSADDAGDIVITVDNLSLGGEDSGPSTQISSAASIGSSGDAGRITIVANTIEISGDATINSSAFAQGDAGVIDITASASLQLRDRGNINTSAERTSSGTAGSIVIDTADLSILDTGKIISATFGVGDAGSIGVTADTALLDAKGVDVLSGISTQADPGTSGNAGDINLTINDLTVRNTAQISSTAFGTGDAGTISVQSDNITIDGRQGNQRILTGIASAVEALDGGEGGAIVIAADRLVLRGEPAGIVSSNDGAASAGTIDITLTDSLILDDGADIETDSASAGGGGITIAADKSVVASGAGSVITTTVADDTGNAGDIVITTPLLALGDSQILARADAGRGGDIRISTDDLVLSPLAEINAEAGATGIDGTVAVSAAEADLTGGLVALDGRFLNVASLLRERCAAKRAEDSSSFTLGTGGVIPIDPDAARPSLRLAKTAGGSAAQTDRQTVLALPCPKAASLERRG